MNLIESPISLDRQGPDGFSGPIMEPYCPCPSVTISGPEALKFPEDCLVTFRVVRGQVVARSATRNQPASASVELKLSEIISIEESDPDEKEGESEYDGESPIDKLFEQASEEGEPEETEEAK